MGSSFLPPDKPAPAGHYKAFASSDAVVAAPDSFAKLAESVRGIGAFGDGSGGTVVCGSKIGVPAFAVKGVSDYGTPDKDDLFHTCAAEVSARWMYAFICKYASLFGPDISVGASISWSFQHSASARANSSPINTGFVGRNVEIDDFANQLAHTHMAVITGLAVLARYR